MDMTTFRIRKAVRCPARPVILSMLVLLGLTGCGKKNFLNENDKLREQNLKLTQQVEELNKQMELRLGEIETLRAQSAGERAIKEAAPRGSEIGADRRQSRLVRRGRRKCTVGG